MAVAILMNNQGIKQLPKLPLDALPGGHFKLPQPWPGQTPPPKRMGRTVLLT